MLVGEALCEGIGRQAPRDTRGCPHALAIVLVGASPSLQAQHWLRRHAGRWLLSALPRAARRASTFRTALGL